MIGSVMSVISPSFKICTNSKLGRHFVAAKPIKAGEMILQEPPLVRGPFIHTVPVCLSCTKVLSSTSQPCSKCGWPVCNSDCENSPMHQPECTLTRSRGGICIKNFGITNPNYQFIIILRALTLEEDSPEKWTQLLELQADGKNYNWAPASFVKTFFKLNNWSEAQIEKVFAILGTNGHELPISQPPELAVYGLGSFFEHSCRANCSKTFTDDGDLVIVAATDIEHGDHLSICYTDPFWGAANRSQHLVESKNFVCNCERCKDPTELGTNLNSIRCLNNSIKCDGFILPESFQEEGKIWRCSKCNDTTSMEKIDILSAKVGTELTKIPKENPEACKTFLKTYSEVLATNHYYLLEVKMVLVQLLTAAGFDNLSNSDLKLLMELSDELIKTAKVIAPAERRFLGLTYYTRGKSIIEFCRRHHPEDSTETLSKVQSVLADARNFLCYEPSFLEEGRLCKQIDIELKQIKNCLKKMET